MALKKRSIENFKAELSGGGVRPTMFQVELLFPTNAVGNEATITENGIFLCKASQIPASNVGNIDVPFRGRKLKVAGDRAFDDWTVTITNATNFDLRESMEKWSEIIQNHNFANGANALEDYFASAIVRQLDRTGEQIRAYKFHGIWPTSVAQIDLDMDNNDTVEDFEVTFSVQYWTARHNEGKLDHATNPKPNRSPRVIRS